VHERGPVDEYISEDCSRCERSEVAWCGVIEAWPKLVPFPVDFQWCLCGEIIEPGTGEVKRSDGVLSYKLEGRRLCVQGELGQNIDCEVCVSAIDARGQELFTCSRIYQTGVQTVCTPCIPRVPNRFDIAVAADDVKGYRPVFAAVGATNPD
jgi:hypothetical protein